MRLINKEGNGKVHKGKAMLIFLDMLDTPEEKNCFQIIYETYSHFLWYLADQILHDAHLAEDAVQETFLALANHMDRVKDPRSRETRNFLGTIVRNKAIDIVRRQKKIKVESYEEWEGQAERIFWNFICRRNPGRGSFRPLTGFRKNTGLRWSTDISTK